jgi:hypothetical protein
MMKYFRFIDGLRKFSKGRMEPEQAIALAHTFIKKRVQAREGNFLNLVQKGVFQYTGSPYRKLFAHHRIGFEDLKSWVGQDGIEASLRRLEREGIYFTVDEFKGRVPVIRDGVKFECNPSMFDNPFLSYVYEVRSGATRSMGTRIRIDFDYLHQRSLYDALLLDIHGCLTAPVANWFPVFPGAPGINSSLRFAHIGNAARRWFSQVDLDKVQASWERKLAMRLVHTLTNLYGCPLAKAEYAGLGDALKIATWASQALEENDHCVIYTFASSAVRVCMAAAEANLNLKGAKFLVTGEPLTPQKKSEIEAVGASAITVYGISEAGVIAAGCNQPHAQSDHCHLYKDTTAIITHKTKVPHTDMTVDALLFTSILYESPKLLLNIGMGDCGDLDSDGCNCGFEKVGFDVHLSNLGSYEKLTGEGVTFVGTDFVWIIEKLLPETFGGKSSDYQVIEQEDNRSLTRLRLMVSPRVGNVNETQLVRTFLGALKAAEDRGWAQTGTQMWSQSDMLQIVRNDPVPTASGKVMPFHLMKL